VTVATTSSQTIDGVLTMALTGLGDTLVVRSDGANWQTLIKPGVFSRLTPTSPVDVVSTTTATAVYTATVKGGTLGKNRTVRLSLLGDLLNNSGGGCTMTVTVLYGGTTIFTGVFTNVNTGANRGFILLDVELTAAGATNAQRVRVIGWLAGTNDANLVTGTAPSRDFAGGSGGAMSLAGGEKSLAIHTSVAEDSTADKDLVVKFQPGTNSANISMRAHTAYAEVK
jgi:hypothetical protein